MPRVRTPNAEQQKTDRIIAKALADAIDRLTVTYPHEFGLQAASRGIREFAQTAVQLPKPRVRKPKAAPLVVEMYEDRKSAAANDDRELSHHSV